MFSPMKMFGFSNRMFSSSSIQSRHFFHMSGYRGANGWISNNPHKRRYCGGCRFNSYLHEGCQVGVVVVQGGDDVELYFHRDSLAQVVLSGDICQSVQQFDLSGPVRGKEGKIVCYRARMVSVLKQILFVSCANHGCGLKWFWLVLPVCALFASGLQNLIQLLHHHGHVDLGAFSKHLGLFLVAINSGILWIQILSVQNKCTL